MRDSTSGRAQAEYFVTVLATRWHELEVEIAERRDELQNLGESAQRSERARNIRRLIRLKRIEVAELQRLCAALTERTTTI